MAKAAAEKIMAHGWFRIWHEMINDPKWRTISRVSGQEISRVQSVFLQIMTSASANENERGRTLANAEDIASSLDLKIEEVEAILEAMQGRILDGDSIKNWSKRQPQKEDGSAERSKKWRENNKLGNNKNCPNATERNRTQPNACERLRTLRYRYRYRRREEKRRPPTPPRGGRERARTRPG